MSKRKILFIDRDNTLIEEPSDFQVDSIHKFKLEPGVIVALLNLQKAGFHLVMVTNQDGLGTQHFPQENFDIPQNLLMDIFDSQGIKFENIRICPHMTTDNCECRKPKIGLLLDYIHDHSWDRENSYVIGDRHTDLALAKNMGIVGILYNRDKSWAGIVNDLINNKRSATVKRNTKETQITAYIDLDQTAEAKINTGVGFFDHMLHQLAKHGGFHLQLQVTGDLHIDEHHTVEDVALTIGQALQKALGDKLGIGRYGFLLPMDEAISYIALDLSGRSYFVFEGEFQREKVGEFPTELVPHFFRSLAESLQATLHIKVQGENTHHMIESIFKGVGRTLRAAITKQGDELPSTKGKL